MATDKALAPNIDNSDTTNFPNARIKDNDGTGNGTAVNRLIYSDIHEFFAKLMRMAAIAYNGMPDSAGNGYQLVDAIIALAGKNDFITPLNTINILVSGVATDVISIPLALSTLKVNETLICKAFFNLGAQTLIKGSEAAVYNATFGGTFKTGDYIRFIKTSGGVTLVRLADDLNLDVLVTELLYLKATDFTTESAGLSQAVATTPYTNQLAFAQRVIGTMSSIFLASASRNGLLSAAQWSIINAIPANPVKNIGAFAGVDPGGGTVGAGCAVFGDITSAVVQSVAAIVGIYGGSTTYLVTMANAMANNNYMVRISLESQGTLPFDKNMWCPVYRVVSTTQFQFAIQEGAASTQNLKVHVEVVQLT